MRYEYYLTQATRKPKHIKDLEKVKSALAYIILLYASHCQMPIWYMLVTTFSCQPKHNPLTKKQKKELLSAPLYDSLLQQTS